MYTSLFIFVKKGISFHLMLSVVIVPSQNVQDSGDMRSSRDTIRPREGVRAVVFFFSFSLCRTDSEVTAC